MAREIEKKAQLLRNMNKSHMYSVGFTTATFNLIYLASQLLVKTTVSHEK
jgi:hypothetical protein